VNEQNVMEFRNLSHWYRNEKNRQVHALDDVSFSIPEGSFTCLVGPSGSGKSSLLNMAAGFISPSEGSVLYRGELITAPSRDRAVVFQEESLFPWMRVQDNLILALNQRQIRGDEAEKEAHHLLDMVGLQGFDQAFPCELSMGMRQKAAIARGLALSGSFLMMDEPFSALDERSRLRLDQELSDLWSRERITILFITHSIEEAIRLGSQILLLSARPGRLVKTWQISPEEKQSESPAFYKLKKEISSSMDLCCPGCRKDA
jgi:ABC-type nitrate/sulfonate/bicarbonate transport system ATPase subunit